MDSQTATETVCMLCVTVYAVRDGVYVVVECSRAVMSFVFVIQSKQRIDWHCKPAAADEQNIAVACISPVHINYIGIKYKQTVPIKLVFQFKWLLNKRDFANAAYLNIKLHRQVVRLLYCRRMHLFNRFWTA